MAEELRELRCVNCDRKIGEGRLLPGSSVKIQCRRCSYLNTFFHVRDPLRPAGFRKQVVEKEASSEGRQEA